MDNVEVQLARLDERVGRTEGRIKDLEQNQSVLHKLATSVELIAQSQQRMEKDLSTLSGKVETLEGADGQKWRGVVSKVVGLLLAGSVGFLLSRLGI